MTLFSKLAIPDNLWTCCVDLFSDNREKWQLVLGSVLGTITAIKLYDLYDNEQLNVKTLKEKSFKLLIRLPFISGYVSEQLSDVDKTISKQLRKVFESESFIVNLPLRGRTSDQIMEDLLNYEKFGKIDWKNGRASGTVYCDSNSDLAKLLSRVYDKTAYTNPLHPDVFPGVNKMEAEIVRMVCRLFKGDNESCGTMTSGGTESIILAVKAFRDYGQSVKGIRKPEIIVPVTAHAAFQKATQLLNMRIKFIEVDSNTFKVNLKAMKNAISSNTVLLVGSACNYPHGIIDDIEGIAKLGLKYSIPVHVDSCLAGFLLPFMTAAGFPLSSADFSVPGVTSISADTHKYGFAPKGSSVIMYSKNEFRRHQYSVQTDWPGGIYATPTLAGSRCGANIASCWATLLHYGFEGYVESTKKIIQTQRYLKTELAKVDGIRIIGDPLISVIALESDKFLIFRLSDKLSHMGWSLNPLQFPSAVHICITLMHTQSGVADAFIADVKHVVEECLRTPSDAKKGMGAIYGMSQSLPDRGIVSDIASHFIDELYNAMDLNE